MTGPAEWQPPQRHRGAQRGGTRRSTPSRLAPEYDWPHQARLQGRRRQEEHRTRLPMPGRELGGEGCRPSTMMQGNA